MPLFRILHLSNHSPLGARVQPAAHAPAGIIREIAANRITCIESVAVGTPV
jgi:hypothetical protein